MKLNYLFPNKYKKIGWTLLIPSVIFGLITLIFDFEPIFLDFKVPAILVDEILGKKVLFGFIENNILNEIVGIFIIVSSILVAFSEEVNEDEYISKIRLESLVWAVYINYGILLVAFLFIYDFSFFWVMMLNMFTILLFFIIRFHLQISKQKNMLNNEE
jgi:hypothetical protein